MRRKRTTREENGKLAVEVFGIVQNLNDYAEELKNQEKLV